MRFWVFCHDKMHMHVYVFLALILLAIRAVIWLIARKKYKDREKEHEKDLEEIEENFISPDGEPAGETPENQEGGNS